jgi:hypothetical protein
VAVFGLRIGAGAEVPAMAADGPGEEVKFPTRYGVRMEGRAVADMAATGRTAPFFIAWRRGCTTTMYGCRRAEISGALRLFLCPDGCSCLMPPLLEHLNTT